MALSRFQVSFLSACLALPILLLMKVVGGVDHPFSIFTVGIMSLLIVSLIPRLYFPEGPPKHDPFYNAWSIFLFASIVDFVIALENDGYVGNYLHFYLLRGEPYLKTAYGTMINYWDGTVHLALVLYVLSLTAYNEEYRLACLYWCGSILNSVAVLIPGGVTGRFGPKWSILLNTPYVVVPLYVLFKVLTTKSINRSVGQKRPQSMAEALFILFFVVFFVINAFRAIVVLGCKAGITKNYLKEMEPFLVDDTAFPKMQMLVYLFYYLPYYVYAIYRILYPAGTNGMERDLAFVHAGAAGQAQFSYITTAIHSRTPDDFRIPSSPTAQYSFWIINLALFIVPHLFAFRSFYGIIQVNETAASPSAKTSQTPNTSPYNLRKRQS